MPGTISTGGNILYCWMIGPTFNPIAVAANTTAEQAFLVPGLLTTDFVDCYAQNAQTAGLGIVNNRVSANGTLQIGFSNSTAGSLTPTAGLYTVIVTRPESLPLPVNAA